MEHLGTIVPDFGRVATVIARRLRKHPPPDDDIRQALGGLLAYVGAILADPVMPPVVEGQAVPADPFVPFAPADEPEAMMDEAETYVEMGFG